MTTKLFNGAELLRIRIAAGGGLPKDSDIPSDQMRAIDNRRLVRGPLRRLSAKDMKRIGAAVPELIGIVQSVLSRM